MFANPPVNHTTHETFFLRFPPIFDLKPISQNFSKTRVTETFMQNRSFFLVAPR